MRIGFRTVAGLGAVVLLLVPGCTDSNHAIAPQTVSTQSSLLGSLSSLLIAPVQRSTPLASDVSWSFVAGPGGAVSTNPAVGLTMAIPEGALSSTQTITVTALAGSPIAYKFEPHGLVFAKKAYLTQDLRVTTAGVLNLLLSGAYFSSDRLELSSSGLAIVSEILSAVVNPLTRTVTFGVLHFSGYIVASGRSSDADDF